MWFSIGIDCSGLFHGGSLTSRSFLKFKSRKSAFYANIVPQQQIQDLIAAGLFFDELQVAMSIAVNGKIADFRNQPYRIGKSLMNMLADPAVKFV